MATAARTRAKTQPDEGAPEQESEVEDAALVAESAKDLAIDFLLKRAFPYGQFAHARDFVESQEMAPEVREELLDAIERNAD